MIWHFQLPNKFSGFMKFQRDEELAEITEPVA